MKKNEDATTGGSFAGSLLLVAFIVLKLTNLISWSWWWVLSPLWIPIIIFALVLIVFKVLDS